MVPPHSAAAVKIFEAVEQRLAEARQYVAVILVRGAAAERRPAGLDAQIEEGDHGAEIVRQHFQSRQPRHDAGKISRAMVALVS